MNEIQQAAKEFSDKILEYYDGFAESSLTQIFMKGHYAGWSEREVRNLAKLLRENNEKYPTK